MTHFCAIYTGGYSENTMKPKSLPISDVWLIKVAIRVIPNQNQRPTFPPESHLDLVLFVQPRAFVQE